jgi:hypothetical protein
MNGKMKDGRLRMTRFAMAMAAVLLGCGSAHAQARMNVAPLPALGMTSPLGIPNAPVGQTGIPMGATELATPGVSPITSGASPLIGATCAGVSSAPASPAMGSPMTGASAGMASSIPGLSSPALFDAGGMAASATSLKYRLPLGQFRVAGIWQFGGYGQNNAANGAYQVGVGGDIPNLANGVLSFDAIYSYVKDSVATSLAGGSTDANGNPIPPFLPQVLTATISDNRAVMLLARYTNGPLKLYAGFEQIRYSAPSDPQAAFTDIAGDFICLGCTTFNNTNIVNTAYGVNGLSDRILQIMWTGVKYAVTSEVDVIAAYYHYNQNSFFGTTAGAAPCSGAERSQCAGTFNAISGVVDWKFAPKWDVYIGLMRSQYNGGLANAFIENNNVATTAGLRFRY